MSQSQVAEAVSKPEIAVRRFIKERNNQGFQSDTFEGSSDIKSLPSKRFQSDKVNVEKDWTGQGNRQTINAIPINVASAFWINQVAKQNKKAEALMYACAVEALERRCDRAFESVKTEEEYESKRLSPYLRFLQ